MNTNTTASQKYIVLINLSDDSLIDFNELDFNNKKLLYFKNIIEMFASWRSNQFEISAIISRSEILGNYGLNIIEILENEDLPPIPVFLLVTHFNENLRQVAINGKIADVFIIPQDFKNIETRVNFVIDNWAQLKKPYFQRTINSYKTPFGKRLFDILFSSIILFLLSPIFLLVYVIIKLESPGPAFYYSYRVGTGYRIFKFYKFRSMFTDADKKLKELKHLNQYIEKNADLNAVQMNISQSLCQDCEVHGSCQFPLFADGSTHCEKTYTKNGQDSAFIKIKDDPRITSFGKFIRNTSIDELPQLVNVLIGNMSIVGNRPLPLYEAEKLTTDKYILRFHAPAGITGLWQVEKRGKGGMSEEERLILDNSYAINHSFKNDLKVILKTIPALLQTENV